MGTSSIYGGPGGGPPKGNPLLPPDFDPDAPEQPQPDPDQDPQDDQDDNEEVDAPERMEANSVPQTSWQSAKTSMAKFASGNAGSAASSLSSYVKAYGGARSASKSMPAGIRTTVSLGDFVNRVASSSFRETLDGYQINYDGKSVTEVLTQLISVLAPSPVTREDSIARKALILTMEELYERVEDNGIDIMDLDAEGLNFIIPCYVKSFINERLLNDLGSRVEGADITPDKAIEIETELREYIDSKVDVVFTGKDFSNTPFTTEEVESIYNQCYTAMEIML
jgi:hypothetical protein